MLEIILVGGGGSLGAVARYIISVELARKYSFFPFGTLLVNLVGSFILALLVGLLGRGWLDSFYRELIGVGFCGGLTTFSTFANETWGFLYSKKTFLATVNLVANFILGLAVSAGGFWLGTALFL